MKSNTIQTPAFIYDEQVVYDSLMRLKNIQIETESKILYAIKSCSLIRIIQLASEILSGFSSSSLFETQLIRDVAGKNCEIHLTTPGILDSDSIDIMRLCSHIYFNSINLYQKYSHLKKTYDFKCGLRINPGLSCVDEIRYNPCCHSSKLGVPIASLDKNLDLSLLDCLHFHTNADSDNYDILWQTVTILDKKIPYILEKISSINLGGGYLFSQNANFDKLYQTISFLKKKYTLDVYLEPGSAVSRNAGCYKVSVLDIFTSDNVNIAIVDGSVNHLPEVFEYQLKNEILEEVQNGKYVYKIAGTTCLAGDQFGLYHFDKPLKVGDILTFTKCGSYSLVKAHMFNGINLPTIYTRDQNKSLNLVKTFDYRDFKQKWF
jgi:carboxynorspermidine decarboxylase